MPDLKDVKIYVSGASAKNDRKYDEIKKFWLAYFKKAGADFDENRYSPKMLDFLE